MAPFSAIGVVSRVDRDPAVAPAILKMSNSGAGCLIGWRRKAAHMIRSPAVARVAPIVTRSRRGERRLFGAAIALTARPCSRHTRCLLVYIICRTAAFSSALRRHTKRYLAASFFTSSGFVADDCRASCCWVGGDVSAPKSIGVAEASLHDNRRLYNEFYHYAVMALK